MILSGSTEKCSPWHHVLSLCPAGEAYAADYPFSQQPEPSLRRCHVDYNGRRYRRPPSTCLFNGPRKCFAASVNATVVMMATQRRIHLVLVAALTLALLIYTQLPERRTHAAPTIPEIFNQTLGVRPPDLLCVPCLAPGTARLGSGYPILTH